MHMLGWLYDHHTRPPHSFVLKQLQAISISYETVVKSEIGLEEKDAVFITNLPVVPLHFLKVGYIGTLLNSQWILYTM